MFIDQQMDCAQVDGMAQAQGKGYSVLAKSKL